MAARAFRFLSFAAALIAVGATSASAAGDDSLTAARKDLETLPATTVAPDGTTTPLDTGKLDLVIPSSGGVTSPTTSSRGPEAPSQGWLLEALNGSASQLSVDSHKTNRQASDARQQKLDTSANAAMAQTWSPFLQAWLLPQNRNLIPSALTTAAAEKNTAPLPRTAMHAERIGNLANVPSAADWLTGDATYHDPLAQRTNPYLDNSTDTRSNSRDLEAPRLTAPVRINNSLGLRDASETNNDDALYPSVGDSRTPTHPEEPMLAPTTPLVNQQKYFPQLDRF